MSDYMSSMRDACQAASSQASGLLNSATAAVNSMVSAAGSIAFTPTAAEKYSVTTTLPTLPDISTDLGIDPAALANELSKLSPELPDAYQKILDEHFPQEDWDSLGAQFEKFLSAEYLDAARAQAVGRIDRDLAARRRATLEAYAERGFASAPGALLGAMAELEQVGQDKVIEVDQTIYAQNLDRWFEFSKFLMDSYLKAKMAEIDAFVKLTDAYLRNYIEVRLRGTELVARIAESLADLRMKAFDAQAERARLSVQLEQLKLGAWEAASKERIQYNLADVQSINASTALRTKALDAAASHYVSVVSSLLGANMSVMTAQGIGND